MTEPTKPRVPPVLEHLGDVVDADAAPAFAVDAGVGRVHVAGRRLTAEQARELAHYLQSGAELADRLLRDEGSFRDRWLAQHRPKGG